mmetsp:Transcript_15065/g.54301  ORF Transcript_15065/g.54301 Transcript_15065/m.54301 type:complete len:206 (-) Transcript_15065:2716-3333(-)
MAGPEAWGRGVDHRADVRGDELADTRERASPAVGGRRRRHRERGRQGFAAKADEAHEGDSARALGRDPGGSGRDRARSRVRGEEVRVPARGDRGRRARDRRGVERNQSRRGVARDDSDLLLTGDQAPHHGRRRAARAAHEGDVRPRESVALVRDIESARKLRRERLPVRVGRERVWVQDAHERPRRVARAREPPPHRRHRREAPR